VTAGERRRYGEPTTKLPPVRRGDGGVIPSTFACLPPTTYRGMRVAAWRDAVAACVWHCFGRRDVAVTVGTITPSPAGVVA